MKTGFNKLALFVFLLALAGQAHAIATIIGGAVAAWAFSAGASALVVAFTFVATAAVTKAIFKAIQPDAASQQPNPGNRQQVPPATDNKLPVIYGTAYTGGTVVDMSITSDNQTIAYVIALCEVTSNGNDFISFGDIYWGGKKVKFYPSGNPNKPVWAVQSLIDPSTGVEDSSVAGKMWIYLYWNGSNAPANNPYTASQVLSPLTRSNWVWQWGSSQKMTNTAFAIVMIDYNQDAGLTGMQQTSFQITNNRYKPGDCLYDYLTNEKYGAAIPTDQIDFNSFAALNTYSAQLYPYTNSSGQPATQERFTFNGVIDTSVSVMTNLQSMTACCDAILRYNEIIGKWGVITQSTAYTVAMNLNDSNMVSAISITPNDLSSTYNIVEVKFPEKASKDAFSSVLVDLNKVAPYLLYPNEPSNKTSLTLPLVNNNVCAQYLAQRFLKAARDDLQVSVEINYSGIQLEAGDIVTVTTPNYGWTNKLFRVMKVTESFSGDGQVTAKLMLFEYNSSVYNDVPITQFQPAPDTGIPQALIFGTIQPPVAAIAPYSQIQPIPVIQVTPYASQQGIVQYAEIWYSPYPTAAATSSLMFAGTTEVRNSGASYPSSQPMSPGIEVSLPPGTWYFFSKMVNNLGKSGFSLASAPCVWKPQTVQFTLRYMYVAYATSETGDGFTTNPRGATYYGIYNTDSLGDYRSDQPQYYQWYPASFGTTNYFLFANRTNRKFSFSVGNAGYQNLGGAFVPSETSVYDTAVWSALPDGQNWIDLDMKTGQSIQAGTTAISAADGLLSVTNNTSGSMIVSLEKYLNFGSGVYTKTLNSATLTIDVYGRVIGFAEPDNFYWTENNFTATAGQTSFAVDHTQGYCLVFRDGILLQPTFDYTETSTAINMVTACTAGEKVIIIEAYGVSTSVYWEIMNCAVVSGTLNSVTLNYNPTQPLNVGDTICFESAQPDSVSTPDIWIVSTVNVTTKTVTVTSSIPTSQIGKQVYRKREAGQTYPAFTRQNVTLSAATDYTPTAFQVANGFESLYVNGVQFSEVDYDYSNGVFSGFPAPVTGVMTFILWTPNNFNIPASNITNNTIYSDVGDSNYAFPNNPLAMEVYANGCLLTKDGEDYTPNSSGYTLTTPFLNNYTLLNQQTFGRTGAA